MGEMRAIFQAINRNLDCYGLLTICGILHLDRRDLFSRIYENATAKD